MVSMFKREVKVGKVVLEYTGSDHVVERLNCTERIEEEIVILVGAESLPPVVGALRRHRDVEFFGALSA